MFLVHIVLWVHSSCVLINSWSITTDHQAERPTDSGRPQLLPPSIHHHHLPCGDHHIIGVFFVLIITSSSSSLSWSSHPRSIILTATAAMAGDTQLFEGAHLTGGNTHFCRESSKCPNLALFVGQIIKYALRIILGFGSNGHPSNKNSYSNMPLQIFGI